MAGVTTAAEVTHPPEVPRVAPDATAPAVASAPSAPALRFCAFDLAGRRLAVEVRCAREVAVVDQVTAVPRAPVYLVGVTNLRGLVLPIADIRALLGLRSRPLGAEMKVLVVDGGSGPVGVVIDAILGLESADGVAPFGEATPRAEADVAVGLVRRGEELVTLLDVTKVLHALKQAGDGR
jgi:purine-binding chemotaxis protein CheW